MKTALLKLIDKLLSIIKFLGNFKNARYTPIHTSRVNAHFLPNIWMSDRQRRQTGIGLFRLYFLLAASKKSPQNFEILVSTYV